MTLNQRMVKAVNRCIAFDQMSQHWNSISVPTHPKLSVDSSSTYGVGVGRTFGVTRGRVRPRRDPMTRHIICIANCGYPEYECCVDGVAGPVTTSGGISNADSNWSATSSKILSITASNNPTALRRKTRTVKPIICPHNLPKEGRLRIKSRHPTKNPNVSHRPLKCRTTCLDQAVIFLQNKSKYEHSSDFEGCRCWEGISIFGSGIVDTVSNATNCLQNWTNLGSPLYCRAAFLMSVSDTSEYLAPLRVPPVTLTLLNFFSKEAPLSTLLPERSIGAEATLSMFEEVCMG